MRIAIEAQRIFRNDKHGMDFVILETLKELQKRKDGNEYYVFVAPGEDRCLEESENLHIIELRCPTYPLWEQIALPQAVRTLKADLLHCTSNTAPLWCPVPLVLTLHDIIYLEPRQHRSPSFYQEMGWHYRRLIVPRILKKARKIITVSQFECTRIREALQLPKEVIKAVYNGYSAYFTMQETPDESIVQKYIPHPDFLFFLGNTDPKKNAARTLKAYALYLQASQTKRPLLIADLKEEYIDQLLQQEGIIGIKEHLYYPGYISNKDLVTLYNAAFALGDIDYPLGSSACFRKDSYLYGCDKYEPLISTPYCAGEGTILNISMCMTGYFYFIPEVMVSYRILPDSLSHFEKKEELILFTFKYLRQRLLIAELLKLDKVKILNHSLWKIFCLAAINGMLKAYRVELEKLEADYKTQLPKRCFRIYSNSLMMFLGFGVTVFFSLFKNVKNQIGSL